MYLVTTRQMKTIEEKAAELGISTLILMENVASALKAEVLSYSPNSILVFTGKGQNAGDGFALARQLFTAGENVKIICVSDPKQLCGDALLNYSAAESLGVEICTFDENECYTADVIVECICGTGFHGELSGAFAASAKAINRSGAMVLCADIPCGINADTGETDKNAVKADKTVTFGFAKRGLYSPLSADYVGEVIRAEISVPFSAAGAVGVNTSLLTDKNVSIPKSSKAANKGTNGRVLIAGGSVGMAGALVLASNAAQRSGAGTVTCAAPGEIAMPLMSQLVGAMYTDIEGVEFSRFDCVLFGNGAGRGECCKRNLRRALSDCRGTLVIDADGLNALAEDISLLSTCRSNVILTPHPLEFSRLTGKSVTEIIKDRIELSTEFARQWGVTVVLKTAFTVVAAADGTAYINTTGNEGMAKGGSGDVLAGIMAGLAPRFSSHTACAACAVYLHGLAGDIAAQRCSKLSLLPSDIIDCICSASREIEKNEKITFMCM